MPEGWRVQDKKNTVALCQKFADENFEAILNSNQTFVNFYPGEYVVAAPNGTNNIWWQRQGRCEGWVHYYGHCQLDHKQDGTPVVV